MVDVQTESEETLNDFANYLFTFVERNQDYELAAINGQRDRTEHVLAEQRALYFWELFVLKEQVSFIPFLISDSFLLLVYAAKKQITRP
jgi:hypothetical protein